MLKQRIWVNQTNLIQAASIIKWTEISVKILRLCKLQPLLRTVRGRVVVKTLQSVHVDVVHEMRDLAVTWTEFKDFERVYREAEDVCTGCASGMRSILELKPSELHCCIKLFALNDQPNQPREQRIATFARSQPSDSRPAEIGLEYTNPIAKNTVWSSILGLPDEETNWKTPYSCFACNDLQKNQHLIRCDRKMWYTYYKSALVFPLKYVNHEASVKHQVKVFGFLAFDSPKIGAFGNIPCIFEHRDQTKWGEYNTQLADSSAFQLGAIMADVLSAFLKPVYENNPDRLNIQQCGVN